MNLFLGGFCIDEPEDDAGFFDGSIGAADANLFDGVSGLTDTCSVDESEGDTLYVYRIFYRITRGAMHVRDDGPLFMEQTVQKG